MFVLKLLTASLPHVQVVILLRVLRRLRCHIRFSESETHSLLRAF
nr:MAG TPA: hypothetical protein [Crassvirales sp.]